MGRPNSINIKPNNRTRGSARAAEKDDNPSTMTTVYRRFPRLGSQFQTKVPASIEGPYQPTRPKPVLMSKEYADVEQDEVSNMTISYTEGALTAERTTFSEPKPVAGPVVAATTETEPVVVAVVASSLGQGYGSRCGIRVSHGPGIKTDTAVRANRAFYLGPVDRDDDDDVQALVQEADQTWLTKLMDWHQLTIEAKQPLGGRRSRFKRRREAPLFPDFGESMAPNPSKRAHLEADEFVLLNPCFPDQNDSIEPISIEQRKWCLNVALSGGRTWRGLRKRRREGELDSWSKVPACTLPMLGDLRSEPVDKPVPLLSASSRSVATTWKAVLAAAEAFEKHMECIRLDILLAFFDHVRRLPPPSQVLDETTRIAQTVNECLNRLWKACTEARELRAKWMDLWYTEGVELDAVRKALKTTIILLPDEYDELKRQLEVVASWQTRLDETLAVAVTDDPECKRDDLVLLEALAHEASATHAFRCKGFVSLQAKIQKTYEMREKLRSVHELSGTVKTISNMVRDIQRLKIRFPEANKLLLYSRDIDTWVERADIAIRSRISLQEIEDLIRRGKEYRLDLSEYMDKLQLRVQQAHAWLESLKSVVDLDGGRLEWMAKIRAKIEGGLNNQLHDLVCEGSRLPVELDFVQMIQIELDARQWSLKAEKWLMPMGEDFDPSKQGKVEELKDHLAKGKALRGRLQQDDRSKWILNFETELEKVVHDADRWYDERYDHYFEGDNRKATSRRSISIGELRRLDEDGNIIPINLGTSKARVSRFLVQAETWYSMHQKLLLDAGLEPLDGASSTVSSESVSLDQLKSAMDDANNGIAFDLEEVGKLSRLIDKLEAWFEQVTLATGAGKRRFRGKKTTCTIEGLQSLIEQASDLPVDTSEAVEMLKERIVSVQDWRKRLTGDLNAVAKTINGMNQSITSRFGTAESFSRALSKTAAERTEATKEDEGPSSDAEKADANIIDPHTNSLDSMIQTLQKEVASSSIITPEMEVVADLETLARWASRSIKYLSCSDDIFDKRFYGAFDRFVSEGQELFDRFENGGGRHEGIRELNDSCWGFLKAQICRMKVLLNERDEFSSWCEQGEKITSNEDRRCTVEKLRDLHAQSQKFPPENELVKAVRELNAKADEWITNAKKSIESEDRMRLPELKAQIDEGEKLGIQCGQLRELKNALKAARSWSNRVKKCKPEQCTTKMSEINTLVDEYEKLMVEMPEEIARLNKAIKHYCICRGNYHGQMVPCEECKDSFHSSCLALTRARADKLDNFICVRCSVKKVYQLSSSAVASIIRKWTSDKELHKARQLEAQKHHRKTRKEQKDLEKYRTVTQDIAQSISQLDVRKCELLAIGESGLIQEQDQSTNQVSGTVEAMEIEKQDVVATEDPPIPPMDKPKEPGVASLDAQRAELVATMEKTTKAMGVCQSRLESLATAATERRNREELENAQAAKLQKWCMLVRNVIAPNTLAEAYLSQPGKDGELSAVMQTVMTEAEKLCIRSYRDVASVENSLKCICWSSRAMEVLRRQPTSDAVGALVAQGQKLKLPEDKALKTLRNMSQRADAWNLRFRRALTPVPGTSDPFDMNELHELAKAADRIPLILPYEHRLETVIEDEGCRYCVCGGPSDGRFMVGCDKCDKWFHGTCVGIRGTEGDELDKWFCPHCRGSPVDPKPLVLKFHDIFDCEADDTEDDDVASKAPDPAVLWPPFGFKDSSTAIEHLGVADLNAEAATASTASTSMAVSIRTCKSEISCVEGSTDQTSILSVDVGAESIVSHSPACNLDVVASSSCEIAESPLALQDRVSASGSLLDKDVEDSARIKTGEDETLCGRTVELEKNFPPQADANDNEAIASPASLEDTANSLTKGKENGLSSDAPNQNQTKPDANDTLQIVCPRKSEDDESVPKDCPQQATQQTEVQDTSKGDKGFSNDSEPQAPLHSDVIDASEDDRSVSNLPLANKGFSRDRESPRASQADVKVPSESVGHEECDFESRNSSSTPSMSGEQSACPLMVDSDSPLRVNQDTHGEVAPVAS